MKKVVLVVSLLTACGYSVPSSDIVIGTKDVESTWDKAVSDIRNENDRVEDNVKEALVKANMDAVAEEHRVNQNVKETGAKANKDTLDTLKKSNEDFVNEEHRVNQKAKDTGLKANEDFNHEQDRATERLVGSDDATLESHEARIEALEAKSAYLEGELTRVSSLESRVSSLTMEDSSIQEALDAGLSYAQGLIAALGSKLDSLTSSDIQGLNEQLATLDAAITDIQLTPGPQGETGAQGEEGSAGPQGETGPQGPAGTPASCSVSTVYVPNSPHSNPACERDYRVTITCGASTSSFCIDDNY